MLVAHDLTDRLGSAGITWEEAGQARLKGMAEPVRVAQIVTRDARAWAKQ